MMTWVLLRGWMRDAAHWGDFLAQLAQAFPGARIATPDLPGNGARHRERSPLRIAGYVEGVRGALHEARLAPPYHVAALSMGGMVAIEWARRHPGEIAAAGLINTSARPFASPFQRLRPRNYAAISRIAAARDPEVREAAILRLTSRTRREDTSLARHWAAIARARPVSRANAARQLAAATHFRAPLHAPPASWIVLCSTRDDLVDPECSRRLAAAWKVPLAEHSAAGHELTLDDGPWVAERLRAAFSPP